MADNIIWQNVITIVLLRCVEYQAICSNFGMALECYCPLLFCILPQIKPPKSETQKIYLLYGSATIYSVLLG